MFKKKNQNKGFTLIELVVTVAVMAVLGTFLFSSYTEALNAKRKEADMEKMQFIDTSIQEIFIHKDAFKEAKRLVVEDAAGNKNTLIFHFPISYDSSSGDRVIDLDDTTLNTQIDKLSDQSSILLGYLKEYIGDTTIVLDYPAYKGGEYEITVVFNGTRVSQSVDREYTITNDNFTVTNSGDTKITEN